ALFREAAAGAGVIPWTHAPGAAVERWFYLLASPPPARRTISLEGARILSGQLRDAVEARGRLVAERASLSRACPLDLHRLLPVPNGLLGLGPDHQESRAWLWAQWGTTEALRGVVELPIGGRAGACRRDPALFWAGFWSADWTPWPALLALRARWPGLHFDLRPLYDGP
ncbi:MAG: transposase, partial [Oceanibaculum sp.]